MPRYYPNSRFSDGRSSVGDVTFYHRNGKCFFRKKPVCTFAGTAEQLVQSDIHRRALAAWQGLGHNVQEVWNLIARDAQSHRPPFGTDSHISGFNLFVSAYHGFARLGRERIPEPRAWDDFPSFFIDNFSVSSSSQRENSIILVCRLHPPSGADARQLPHLVPETPCRHRPVHNNIPSAAGPVQTLRETFPIATPSQKQEIALQSGGRFAFLCSFSMGRYISVLY